MYTFVCEECGAVKEVECDSDIQTCDNCSKLMINETMSRHTSISLSEVMDRSCVTDISESDFQEDVE